ncbi:MAG: MoxR family ATPase [Thermoanaerobaculia bacterium]
MMSLRLGYPPREQERELLISGGVDRILADLEPVVSREDVLRLQARAEEVQVADKLADYILSLAEATRDSAQFVLGVSTRGVQNLYRATQAMALCEGRPFATPDDVQGVAMPVFAHRVLLKNGGGGLEAARTAVARVVDSVPIPV